MAHEHSVVPHGVTHPPAIPQFKTIPLTQGKVAIVDEHNYAWLNQFKWYAENHNGRWYAARKVRLSNGKWFTQYMHREIMGVTDPAVEIDHIALGSESGLDNRESNIRIATPSQNACNAGLRKHNTSGFKGVMWHKRAGKWSARIAANKKSIWLGLFNTAIEAAAIWNWAARRLHGVFAYQNDLSQEVA